MSELTNIDSPFKKSQLLVFILFCENFSHSNITCMVFSSVYVFSFFSQYRYFIFDGCEKLRLLFYSSVINPSMP